MSKSLEYDIVKYTTCYETAQKRKDERYASWRPCFEHFGNPEKSNNPELTNLRLGFFLASWGMYRGSGFLLKLDETVHEGIADIVQCSEFQCLHGYNPTSMEEVKVEKIANLYEEIEAHYKKKVRDLLRKKDGEWITYKWSVTATLVTKVMLGTTGCIIAFDDYATTAIKKINCLQNLPAKSAKSKCSLRMKTIKKLWQFYFDNKDAFDEAQRKISECRKKQERSCQPDYPPMKLLDMYLWKIGFELELKEKKQKQKQKQKK